MHHFNVKSPFVTIRHFAMRQIRIFKCNRGLTIANLTHGADHCQLDARPAITFENANASYLAQGLQQAGTTYHCLLVADFIYLTNAMHATVATDVGPGAFACGSTKTATSARTCSPKVATFYMGVTTSLRYPGPLAHQLCHTQTVGGSVGR